MTAQEKRAQFEHLYQTDPAFHQAVDGLMFGEVADLRAALAKIQALRRDSFPSGFAYERAVREQADTALQRLTVIEPDQK